MTSGMKLLLAAAVAAIVAVGALVVLRRSPSSPPARPAMHATPVPAQVQPTPSQAVVARPFACDPPGTPPDPPDGATADAAEMHRGHDALQAFVIKLEAFQTCRNNQADNAPVMVTDQKKQEWIEEGNAAVDEANALAAAYKTQLQVFKARHPQP